MSYPAPKSYSSWTDSIKGPRPNGGLRMRLWDGIRSRCCACKIAAPVVALNVVFSCAAAQSPAENSPPLKPESMTVLDSTPAWLEVVPVELKDPTTAAADLCRDKPGDPDWLSQVRAGHLPDDVFIGSLVRRLLRQRSF